MLQIKNINCRRNDRELFSAVSTKVAPGEIVQVCGSNGSGKTTLLRMVTGLFPLTTGDITWFETSIKNNEHFAADCFYLGHRHGMKAQLTPYENLKFSVLQKDNFAFNNRDALDRALELWGVAPYQTQLTKTLSQGLQRRVSLTQLSLLNRTLWVLDEPFTSLDRQTIALLTKIIQQHTERGGMVLLASHRDVPLAMTRTIHLNVSSQAHGATKTNLTVRSSERELYV